MLKKKIAAVITAVVRICKCGKTITLSTINDKTICECGEVVYDAKNSNNINGETTHEKAEFKAGDSSTKSRDFE